MKRMISRRNILRGTGVCLALPWLETFAPRGAMAQSAAPKRFLPIFFPNGTAHFWRPAGEGATWQLSPILEPFANVKEKMSVITGMASYPGITTTSDVQPSHSRLPGTYLTCVDHDAVRDATGQELANGISIDQLIADAVGSETALPSMQVGLSTVESYCDGRHCSLSQSTSWSGPHQPLYKDVNPRSVFDRLVMSGATDSEGGAGPDPAAVAEAERRRALQLSVLDGVMESAAAVQPRLTRSDNMRMEEFLTSVRELESRVETVGGTITPGALGCNVMAQPADEFGYGLQNGINGYDKAPHATVMNDLIVMALQCDTTRIISYMLDDARSEFNYTHVPIREFSETGSTEGGGGGAGEFHGSQHAGDTNNGFASINHWLSGVVADLAEKLDAVPEGEGTLLDNMIMIYGSPMHGGNHAGDDLPIALLGGGGGVFATNQHVVNPGMVDRAMSDLWMTIANDYFGLGISSFGQDVRGLPPSSIAEILA